jgi:hypothetical protein
MRTVESQLNTSIRRIRTFVEPAGDIGNTYASIGLGSDYIGNTAFVYTFRGTFDAWGWILTLFLCRDMAPSAWTNSFFPWLGFFRIYPYSIIHAKHRDTPICTYNYDVGPCTAGTLAFLSKGGACGISKYYILSAMIRDK